MNVETHKVEKVSNEQISDYYIDLDSKILYYFVVGKGLYKSNLDGTMQKLLYKADDNMIVARLSYDGNNIYIYNSGMGSLTDVTARADRIIVVLDSQFNTLRTIECGETCDGVYFGDEHYLFISQDMKAVYMDKNDIVNAQWNQVN